jgi:hypothetical protein
MSLALESANPNGGVAKPFPCTDCGTLLTPGATGCNTCGRNIAFERQLARALVWIAIIVACSAVVMFVSWLAQPA